MFREDLPEHDELVNSVLRRKLLFVIVSGEYHKVDEES